MRYSEFHYRWEWDLSSSPEQFWDWIADTNRFNHDAGVPPIERVPGSPSLDAGRRLRLRVLGLTVEWDEEPFEWVRPRRFGVVRRYRSGPIAEIRVLAELTPRPEAGTHFVYQVWVRPASLLGVLAIPVQVGWINARGIDATVRRYDRIAAAGNSAVEPEGQVRFASGGRARLTSLGTRLLHEGAAGDLVELLGNTLQRADDMTVSRLRPYALADAWGRDRGAVLELCLLATRAGLLDLRWELLCPLCRGAQKRGRSLSEVESRVHCASCNIDFTVAFDRSVELTFRPNPAVRAGLEQEFCIGGPQLTPHVVLQQGLEPGERRTLQVPLEAGRHRVRTLQQAGGVFLQAATGGAPEAVLQASDEGWPAEELRLSESPVVHLENATQARQLFILERMAWSDQAATAAEVLARQSFRDLFSSEALRPGERISVGSMTVVFTDLRGSTPLYREMGDAPAFGLVMEHFEVLREAIAAEGGAIVKTMGDAVMGVFMRPASALRALLLAQQRLGSPSKGRRPLVLKAGVHTGPCIAVTLNERLDYFGSTVNLAARLEGLSSGGDIVISEAVYEDPEVIEELADTGAGIVAESFEAALKGFDQERFRLWRVTLVPSAAEAAGPAQP